MESSEIRTGAAGIPALRAELCVSGHPFSIDQRMNESNYLSVSSHFPSESNEMNPPDSSAIRSTIRICGSLFIFFLILFTFFLTMMDTLGIPLKYACRRNRINIRDIFPFSSPVSSHFPEERCTPMGTRSKLSVSFPEKSLL